MAATEASGHLRTVDAHPRENARERPQALLGELDGRVVVREPER
ncbi:MAG TPA: hypothetical protein VN880_16340 [Solirubrobacteraceae bacterium]|jgi:hypothetical protein|nr:hypothetical protein [Solirubrobacteraceae bacterium]